MPRLRARKTELSFNQHHWCWALPGRLQKCLAYTKQIQIWLEGTKLYYDQKLLIQLRSYTKSVRRSSSCTKYCSSTILKKTNGNLICFVKFYTLSVICPFWTTRVSGPCDKQQTGFTGTLDFLVPAHSESGGKSTFAFSFKNQKIQ